MGVSGYQLKKALVGHDIRPAYWVGPTACYTYDQLERVADALTADIVKRDMGRRIK
jgi:hypothetical protein